MNPMNPNANPTLPSAVPTLRSDINEAWMLLGQNQHYLLQVQAEMLRRAEETNVLHDAYVAARRLVAQLLVNVPDEDETAELLAQARDFLASSI